MAPDCKYVFANDDNLQNRSLGCSDTGLSLSHFISIITAAFVAFYRKKESSRSSSNERLKEGSDKPRSGSDRSKEKEKDIKKEERDRKVRFCYNMIVPVSDKFCLGQRNVLVP